MGLTPDQQFIEAIGRAQRVLVLGKAGGGVATAASVAALASFLEKKGKRVDAVTPGFGPDQVPGFLSGGDSLKPALGGVRAFEISVDVQRVPLEELTHAVKDGVLTVSLVPRNGEWSPKDISFRHGEDRYDLIIALDCPDMASLGEIAREHADLVHRLPVVNIDVDAANEHWGQINIVDLTAASSGEVLYRLFCAWDRHAVDEDLATALLAGMIAKTRSFRTAGVTPKTLQTSSELVALGARREDIVHGLWRTKSVAMLRLWGKALTRLEQDATRGLVWATLTRNDFVEAGAHPLALEGIVDELLAYAPEAKVVALIHEHPDNVEDGACVSVHATSPYSAHELCRGFGAHGSRERAQFTLPKDASLIEGGMDVIKRLQDAMDAIA